MVPSFARIVDTGTSLYAEIFWQRGELGAPYPQWWDLSMCEHRIKTAPTEEHKRIYQQAKDVLEQAIKAKSK